MYDSDLTTECIVHQLSNSVHFVSYHTTARDIPPSQNGYGCFFFFGAAAVAPAVAAREEETSLTWTLLLLARTDFESAATGMANCGQMDVDMAVSSCCGIWYGETWGAYTLAQKTEAGNSESSPAAFIQIW